MGKDEMSLGCSNARFAKVTAGQCVTDGICDHVTLSSDGFYFSCTSKDTSLEPSAGASVAALPGLEFWPDRCTHTWTGQLVSFES